VPELFWHWLVDEDVDRARSGEAEVVGGVQDARLRGEEQHFDLVQASGEFGQVGHRVGDGEPSRRSPVGDSGGLQRENVTLASFQDRVRGEPAAQ
jgi:hypothetical protein